MPLYVCPSALLSRFAPLQHGDPTPLSLGRSAPTTPVGSPLIQDMIIGLQGA